LQLLGDIASRGQKMLGEIATTTAERAAEYRVRRSRYHQKTFRKDEAEHANAEGWELVRENQSSDRYQKIKPHDEQLENEVWCLLYNFGYPHLSIGRKFQIEITKGPTSEVSKQIDVFAYDSETIIVCECKSSEKRGRRSLQKDIGEFAANQRPIANTLRKFLGGKIEQKIIWLFVTRNIDWLDPDRARAAEHNIKVITEKELFYYKEIAKRIGHAARYQFHAEFLEKSKVSALEHKLFALRSKLGPHRAYTFFSDPRHVLPITFVNHRDLRDPNAAPSYQRLIHKQRIKDIAQFLRSGGFFPNAVILNFKRKIRFDIIKPEDDSGIAVGEITLPNTYKSAWIIDGQHRLFSYTELDDEDPQPPLPFLAFENIAVADETKIFADINSKQKSVSRKLLDEITGEIKIESTNKREQIRAIASRSFDLMRDNDDGPLGDKIAGTEIKSSEGSILTIPYLVDATIQSGILGKVTPSGGEVVYFQGPLFWDEPRAAITAFCELVEGYFDYFRRANPQRWDAGKSGMFATNVGAAGLIRLLSDLISFMSAKENEEPRLLHPKIIVERIEKYAEPVIRYFKDSTDDEIQTRLQTPFGSGGPSVFQHRLRELINNSYRDFDPPGFQKDLRKYDEARKQDSDKKVRIIQEAVHSFVLKKLKEMYGDSGNDDYLAKAIDNKKILEEAFSKRLDADEADRKDLGTYLDFIDLRKIVEIPRNWEQFKPQLNIQLPDEQNGRAKYLGWFDEINKLRRISAHPYNRGYDDNQVEKLGIIFEKLKQRAVVPAGER
jgi:DGQHR domain-containing protein